MSARFAAASDAADRRRRNAEIAKIKIGAKALALVDDTYRAVLQREGGAESAKDLTAAGRRRVLEHFKKLGAYGKEALQRPTYSSPQARMIRGLWIELADAGVVRNRSDRALDAFARRVLAGRPNAPESVRWLSDPDLAGPVIEALKAMRDRAAAASPTTEGAAE